MQLGTWNVRSHYRSGSLKMVAMVLAKHKILWESKRSGGTRAAVNQQMIIHLIMELKFLSSLRDRHFNTYGNQNSS
jgi:hypothetical protein